MIGFYLAVDGERIRNSLVGLAPKRVLPHVLLFEDALNRVVGNYIRGQLFLALIIGVLSAIGCVIFRLGSYALIVGVLAFVFETIPMVGPALAAIPALLISLLLPDPFPRTLYILIYFICMQLIESNILGPRIVGHAVGLHPVASLLALIIGVQLFGAFGALLATPIVATLWVVISSLYRSIRGQSADEVLATSRRGSLVRRHTTSERSTAPPKYRPARDKPSATKNTQALDIPRQPENPREVYKDERIDLLRPIPSASNEEKAVASDEKTATMQPTEGQKPDT